MRRWVYGVGCVLVCAGASAMAAEVPRAILSREVLPAAGKQSAILTIDRFGRYAITAKSAQGTALQLVDRMAGPGETAGEPGVTDGRLDVFLEHGEYKVLTGGHAAASGTVRLTVHPFVEGHTPRAPRLVELKLVEAELRDVQQRSYWIEITERRTVDFEAAGRSLGDLRLWRDGEWLVDATPARESVQPRIGEPLLIHRLTATLDPGLYLLTAYGGPARPWASGGDAHPFYLRFGIPRLGEATRARHTLSPFGIDRYRVPGASNYLRLELPEAAPLTALAGRFDAVQPFADRPETQLEITKKSVPPVAEVELTTVSGSERFVTVRGAAGQPYILQSFEARESYYFKKTGDYWISSVHSGQAVDSVDATGLLADWGAAGRAQPMLTEVLELDARTPWARRANLLDRLTLFFQVQAGTYSVVSKGTAARFRIEPFMLKRPEKYEPPAFRDGGGKWELDAGLYVLTIEPVKKGILDVALKPAGLMDTILDGLGMKRDVEVKPVQASVRFPRVHLVENHAYTMFLNHQPAVTSGIVLRPLPLDLAEPLPLSMRPGESVNVPFRASENGMLAARAEDGSRASISVDGGPVQEVIAVAPGAHTVLVRHGGRETVSLSLALLPQRLDPQTPLPEVPEATIASIPKWPVVAEGAAQVYDLERRQSTTFNVLAAKPGLYRLETTGLLAMEGRLRTRTVTSFASAEENGTGRNALLQQYLREGDYQVTFATRGQSAGHGGLVLSRATPMNGGFLTSGLPARASLAPGQAVMYRFQITTPGRFRVRALGLGRTVRWRIEDDGGWPLIAPNGEADFTRELAAGRYRIVVLPEASESRVVTWIEPVRAQRESLGHGPHRLAPGETAQAVWLEASEGAERTPDIWEWRLPAPVTARVALAAQMQGSLVRVDASGARTPMATVPADRPWHGVLEAGQYQLEVVGRRRNNRLAYAVGLTTEELVAGAARGLTVPADVPVSVGSSGLVEIASFGDSDVKARLFDSEGRVVAENDDRPDDWNFLLVAHLSAGRYRLRVDPVGSPSGQTHVSLRIPRDEERPPLALPMDADVRLRRASHLYPVLPPPGGGMLVVEASATSNVGLALEAQTSEGWRSVASSLGRSPRLAVPLPATPTSATYRLRLWSVDRRESTVRLRAGAPVPMAVSEAQLRKGVALGAAPGLTSAAVHLTVDRPGLLRVAGDGRRLWCVAPGRACVAQEGEWVSVPSRDVWLVADVPPGSRPTLRAERVRLGANDAGLTVKLAPESRLVCDLEEREGPILVTATSQIGTPGVAVLQHGEPLEPRGATMAAGAHAAVSASLGGGGAFVLVWPASGGSEPFDVTLTARRYPRPVRETSDGLGGVSLGAGQVRVLPLPAGPKRVRVALGEGVVAAFVGDKARVRSVHWGDGKAFVESAETDAVALALFETRGTADRAALEVLPLDRGDRSALVIGSSVEQAYFAAGTSRLTVASSGGPSTLHVRGADETATFVSASGRIVRGRDLAVGGEAGVLLVPHRPGRVLAWLDRPGDEANGLWGERAPGEEREVKPPSIVSLADSPLLVLHLDRPAMLHFRSPESLVTRLTREGEEGHVELHPEATRYDAYLKPGRSTLALRALAGASLSGTAELSLSPVTAIGDGLGPELLLAPGAARVFSFEVARKGPVGIGVRATAEIVDAVLMSDRGEVLGRGTSQMPILEPGTYLLALNAPADAAPVTARASLVGLKVPDVGPPQEVIHSYLAPEEVLASAGGAARRGDEEPAPGSFDSPAWNDAGADSESEGAEEPEGSSEAEGETERQGGQQ